MRRLLWHLGLANQTLEFMPYVFQLFAALLEARPQGPLSEYYKALVAPILVPSMWESRGNVPALSRLLSSIIPRSAADIVANSQVEPILGIFQRLLAGKTRTELFGFDVLEAVLTSIETSVLIADQLTYANTIPGLPSNSTSQPF